MDDEILAMLMQGLTEPEPGPGGNIPDSMPAGAVPADVQMGDPTAELNALLQQILQMVVMSQSAQASANAMHGMDGGMYGGMGGRPPGGAELQNPELGMMF